MTNTKDTTKANEVVVLKQDGLGRVKVPAARREQILDEFERSGLSGKKFAALAGIKYQTFATWAQKRRQQSGRTAARPTADPVRWLEAVVTTAQTSGQADATVVRLSLPGGVRLELNDAKQVPLVATLLRALEKPC